MDALLLAPDAALPELPEVVLDTSDTDRVVCGQKIDSPLPEPGTVRLYGPGRRFLGLGEVRADGQLAPRRLFQTAPDQTPCRSGESAAAELETGRGGRVK